MAENGVSKKLFIGFVALEVIGRMSEGVENKLWYAAIVAGIAVFCVAAQLVIDWKRKI